MRNFKEKIKTYFLNLPKGILPVSVDPDLKVEKISGGDYNLNFKINVNGEKFLLRLNVEAQSGLKNQIMYEYKTLKFLEPYKIAPKAYYLDDSKKHFPFGLIIEEFIAGKRLEISLASLKKLAKTLARLHTIPLGNRNFLIRWQSPLKEQLKFVTNEFNRYRQRKIINKEFINIGSKIINKVKSRFRVIEKKLKPTSIIHTDLVASNIIDTGYQAYLVDWEKGRIEDPSYDIAFFLCPLMNLWDWPRILTEKEKEYFLKVYEEESGDKAIRTRINYRIHLIILHLVLWAGNRIADVKEGLISKELGRQNYVRYRKLFDLNQLRKYL
ncbi:phosphotransferase [Patescibacteria group bacterium]|nr:phosphotransferase [Patescibacteria group bacterium]